MAKRGEVKPVYTEELRKMMMRSQNADIHSEKLRHQISELTGLTPEVAGALRRELQATKGLVAPRNQVGYKKPTTKES